MKDCRPLISLGRRGGDEGSAGGLGRMLRKRSLAAPCVQGKRSRHLPRECKTRVTGKGCGQRAVRRERHGVVARRREVGCFGVAARAATASYRSVDGGKMCGVGRVVNAIASDVMYELVDVRCYRGQEVTVTFGPMTRGEAEALLRDLASSHGFTRIEIADAS